MAAAKAAGQPIPKFFKDIMTSDLRLEMAGKGSGTHCVVVGAWAKGADGKEAFQPCLTVDDNCNVIVEKNLIIKGFISQMQGGGPYTVTPEVRSMMLGAYASQATGIAGQVQQLFAGAGNITPEMLLKLLELTEGRLAVLDTLFSDQNLRDDFIVALLNHPNNSLTGQQAVLVILRGDAARAKAVVDWFMADDTSRTLLATTLLGAANGQDTLAKTLIANLPDLDSLLGGVLIELERAQNHADQDAGQAQRYCRRARRAGRLAGGRGQCGQPEERGQRAVERHQRPGPVLEGGDRHAHGGRQLHGPAGGPGEQQQFERRGGRAGQERQQRQCLLGRRLGSRDAEYVDRCPAGPGTALLENDGGCGAGLRRRRWRR